jgi:hypothetical protein
MIWSEQRLRAVARREPLSNKSIRNAGCGFADLVFRCPFEIGFQMWYAPLHFHGACFRDNYFY